MCMCSYQINHAKNFKVEQKLTGESTLFLPCMEGHPIPAEYQLEEYPELW